MPYIGNIRHEGFQPSLVGSGRQACEMWSRKEHFCHKARKVGMGLDIGFQCKLCYQDSQYHADIHLF